MAFWTRRIERSKSGSHRKQVALNRRRLNVEALEDRILLTSTLFVDFGDGFVDPDGLGPLGPQLSMTVQQLRQTLSNGGIQGPDLRSYYADTAAIAFKPLASVVNFDYNGDSVVDGGDVFDLKSDVMNLIRRSYEPFNIDVVEASNQSVAAIRSQLMANNGLSVGRNDAYMLVSPAYVSGVSVGSNLQAYGVAPGSDASDLQNLLDDTALAFADVILANLSGSTSDTALAFTTAHEAGHAFGLRHSSSSSVLSGSDLLSGGGTVTNRFHYNFVTRFPLPAESGSPSLLNAHDQLLADPDIGAAQSGANYITGSGADDHILVVKDLIHPVNPNAPLRFRVDVNAFSGAALIASHSYYVYGAGGMYIEAGRGSDTITIDPGLGQNVTVYGMDGNDTIRVSGWSEYQQYVDDSIGMNGTGTRIYFAPQNAAGEADASIESIVLEGTSGPDFFALTVTGASTAITTIGLGGSDKGVIQSQGISASAFDQSLSGDEIVPYRFVGGQWVQLPGRFRFNQSGDTMETVALYGTEWGDIFKIFNLSAATRYEVFGLGAIDTLNVYARNGVSTGYDQTASGDEIVPYEFLNGVWTQLAGRVKYNQFGDVLEAAWFHGSTGNDGLKLFNLTYATHYQFFGNGGSDILNVYARNGVSTGYDQTASGDEIVPYEFLNGVWTQLAGRVKYNQFGDVLEAVWFHGSTGTDVFKLLQMSETTSYAFWGNEGSDTIQVTLDGATVAASGPDFVQYRKNGVLYAGIWYYSAALLQF
jgi:hypothetical protein